MLIIKEMDDDATLKSLQEICREYNPVEHGGERLQCCLMLQDAATLWLLRREGLSEWVTERADVLSTTVEDLLAKNVLVRLPNAEHLFPPLDCRPISFDSEERVHLVIFGSGAMAEAFMVNAAQVAHYPNYCRDTRLRTRITVVDSEVMALRNRMLQRYGELFEHSFHRVIDLVQPEPVPVLHRPKYDGRRRDFVDIEWEFVKGSCASEAVRQKLAEWSEDEEQQLTVAICREKKAENTEQAFSLPEEVYRNDVTVFCLASPEGVSGVVGGCKNVYSFDEGIASVATLETLKRMAMGVNYVYNHAFAIPEGEAVTAPAEIDRQDMQRQWDALRSFTKESSNLCHAMSLGTKLHSMGLSVEDWDDYFALTVEEMEVLAEVEHNRWSVEELMLGYRPVTDEEQKAVEKDIELKGELRKRKVHYDLRAYDELGRDATGKNVNVYDMALVQGIPLILKEV